eukprot:CAMPEP_0183302884 /NCGR_PEP_ID=MMETSP0160_2-20130417/8514_1 /TAXON_ID=2839 ORGANISM="Odontella Sinensis, Strain Grunow 1884" /NCGR_SAMPLE_ID=MMETSP0160_2 /ASSEMBLY_ACC=CAM_ASM_000250 /LENGTH=124 /DNA_ID=CAMNT_0025465709 /DNA_START=51 /DNA_END=425 /DNA_ORIENTATION=-
MAHLALPPDQQQLGDPASASPTGGFASIDLDSIPGQIGSAILRASDGAIVQPPPPAVEGGLSDRELSILYRMIREAGDVIPDDEGLRRIEVSFQAGGPRYTVALVGDGGGDGYVFVVKRRQTEQ